MLRFDGAQTAILQNQGEDSIRNKAGNGWRFFRLILWSCLIGMFLTVSSEAQYKGDHIPGFTGLSSGTQQPPGIYVGDLVWVYPISTVKDDKGNAISLPGSITSTIEAVLGSVVTNRKMLGGNIGVTAVFPFIKNEIQAESLDITSSFALSDSIVGGSLGWHFKRSDATIGYNLYPVRILRIDWELEHRPRHVGQ